MHRREDLPDFGTLNILSALKILKKSLKNIQKNTLWNNSIKKNQIPCKVKLQDSIYKKKKKKKTKTWIAKQYSTKKFIHLTLGFKLS